MKVEIENKVEKEVKYPCLMVADDGLIVLFRGRRDGVIVSGNTAHWIGERSDTWDMEWFKPFEGKITLSND